MRNHTRQRNHRVCLFGTSANPPTGESGHVGIVKALSALGRSNNNGSAFDEIRVVPVYRHMFSEKRHKLVSFSHRLNMCKAAFGNIPKVDVSDAEYRVFLKKTEGMAVDDKENLRNVRVGTADLLETLVEEEPDTDFTFCLGADAFADLVCYKKWKRSEDILRLLEGRIICFYRKEEERDGYNDEKKEQEQQLQQQELEALIKLTNDTNMLYNDNNERNKGVVESSQSQVGAKLLYVPTLGSVSSTKVRDAFAMLSSSSHASTLSLDLDESIISPKVLSYIQENNLYMV